MLKNYVTTALRNLRRHPGYAAINIAGLALGFGVSVLLLTVAWAVLTLDRFHERADDLYTAVIDMDFWSTSATWAPLKEALEDEFPSVVASARLYNEGHQVYVPPASNLGDTENGQFFQENVLYTDPSFFEVFSFELLRGDETAALARPDAVLLTEATARKYFGNTDPIGRTVLLNGQDPLVVTGILKAPPPNSSIRYSAVASFQHATMYSGKISAISDDWNLNYVFTYLRLRPDTDVADLQAYLPTFLAKYRAETNTSDFRMKLVPMAEVNREPVYAWTAILLALGILLLAGINFTNLATARSMDRAREIGMRKVLGAHRWSVAGQFLSESVLVTLVALLLGLGLTQALLPSFNQILNGMLVMDVNFQHPVVWIGLLALGLLVGIGAGAYPAFFLARFRPTETLKGRLSSRPQGKRLRNGLVVVQFVLTAGLLAGTVVMNQQMQYVAGQTLDLGDQPRLVVPISEYAFDDAAQGYERLRTLVQELQRNAEVASATLSSAAPGGEYWQSLDFGLTPETDQPVSMHFNLADEAFLETYGIRLLDGRIPRQRGEVVLNETALAALGERAGIGQTVYQGGQPLTIVGVAQDIHFASLKQQIRPEAYLPLEAAPTEYQYLTVRAAGTSAIPVINQLNALWPTLNAKQGLTYVFASDYYARAHQLEQSLTRILTLAAAFALLIALTGLVGITSLSVAQRTKEIGVRKVLGASAAQVALLLARRFAVLVLIAIVLASPVAFVAVQTWLQGFVYRIALGPSVFVWTGVVLLSVAMLTIVLQTIRAALADPVKSLRYE